MLPAGTAAEVIARDEDARLALVIVRVQDEVLPFLSDLFAESGDLQGVLVPVVVVEVS